MKYTYYMEGHSIDNALRKLYLNMAIIMGI